ncbi:MAG: phosphoglucomutase/phosphomannomutase family protein [Bacteroidota bacterium]
MVQIKFGTDGWRAIIAKDYTFDNLTRVTEATAEWLKETYDNPSAMVGYDCRFHGDLFARHVANIFAQQGIKVYLSPGFVSTPMVSLATEKRKASAGIVITASHNPPTYSGFKIKGHFGGPAFPSMIDDVETRIPDSVTEYADRFDEMLEAGQIEYDDMEALYIDHITNAFDLDAIRNSGMKIGYDPMYGAGQNVIRKIFPKARLLHAEFNPSFHGTPPEPIERNLKEFQQVIRDEGLDIGLATDGDADRIGLFDQHGNFVDSHHILLLLIHYLVNHKKLTGKVVSTFSCTSKIKKLCKHYGLENQVTKIGFKYICEIMVNDNVIVGGEESGGIAIAGHVPERDGIFIGLTLMEFMAKSGKSLTDLINEIYDLVGSFKFGRNDLHLSNEKKLAVIEKCKNDPFQSFGDYQVQRIETIDGFKFYFDDDTWTMIRPSGTEPVLRIYSEAADMDKVNDNLEKAVSTENAFEPVA